MDSMSTVLLFRAAAGSTYYIVEAREGAGRAEREGDEAANKKWMGDGRGKFGVGSATA